jgi:cytoskeletal protein CcmA (bactofilin family)
MEVGDLAVEPGGSVSGTITYARLKVGAGGIVEGSFKHRASEAAPAEKGSVKLVDDTAERTNLRRAYVD